VCGVGPAGVAEWGRGRDTRGVSESPTIFVLFGATGDLAARMVLPAFFALAQKGLMPDNWRLIGNGRGDVAHEDFRAHVRDVLNQYGPKPEDGPWEEFAKGLLFAGGGFDSDDPGSLLDVIEHAKTDIDAAPGETQLIHYLATPPVAFEETAKALGVHGLTENARVVFEKPYGTSPESFKQLDETVHSVLKEEQVFRIDHFLGKEATQNLHVVRFANQLFAGIWSREHVAAVQIDVPETLDVANRAGFYDATGATIDMLVTHLIQVAAEVAMEPPASLDAGDLQDARESVISSFRPIDPSEVVLGQFDGYLDIDGVADGSTTDTFAAARLWVDTDRWRGVPFLLRTGKRLADSQQRVSLVMRPVEGPLNQVPTQGNVVTFSLAGDGDLEAALVVKEPGAGLNLVQATESLALKDIKNADPLPPYVALLNDVLLGDRSLFTSSSGLEHAWRVADPLLKNRPEVQPYQPGTWGPDAAAELAKPGTWLLGS
jgi:glucose-6-phosphate 1-dehydrogenase